MATHRFRRLLAVLGALSLVFTTRSADLAAITNVPLPVVLGVRRLPELDQWITVDGQSQSGAIGNDVFRLQTGHGEIRVPREVLAAIDLTRQRQGIDVLITRAGDRLSGVMLEPFLRVQSSEATAPEALRRECVARVLFALSPAGLQDAADAHLILFRNGDFCRGRVGPNPVPVNVVGSNPRDFLPETVQALMFPDQPGGPARVESTDGETWEGALPETDLRITLGVGLELGVYSDRIAWIRRQTTLPFELSERIGVPATPSHRPSGPTAAVRAGMVWIPPGEFVQGSPNEEQDRDLDEGPLTRVILPAGFWMGAHEVTQAEYEAVIGRNPSQYTGDNQHPVEKVNWQEAVDFCRTLNALELAAGRLPEGYVYRLPTEAEWEYACRAGSTTRFSFGNDPGYVQTAQHAWCSPNSDSTTHPVGTRKPNAWGLFDMHGNVWEWCLDAWSGGFPGGGITNAAPTPRGSLRVARGGSWLYDPRFCRSANRDSYGMFNRCSDVGFRVVLAPAD